MSSSQSRITCPNCQAQIDVNDILAHQLEEKIRAKYIDQQNNLKAEMAKKEEELFRSRHEFEEKKKRENELFQERLDSELKRGRSELTAQLKKKLEEEQMEQYKSLQQELNEKSEKLKELNRFKSEIERLKREKDELKELIEAENQILLNKQIAEEKEKIRKSEENKNELRIRELQKQLEDQRKLTEEMKRKQEQGSMQMQGEVQELAVEEWLRLQFPLDTIEEIKKGARGADCKQIIHTRNKQNCGTIYYECKRTKDFQPSWIEKFKADIRSCGANMGVLITDSMPANMDRMGLKDGIWICTYEEFKGLCLVLRESIIKLSDAIAHQENRGDKMHMLYDYLTGNTFRLQIEAIVDGFTQMKMDLESEKRSFQRIWKQREKQLEKVLLNTIDMHGSIRGIAGNAVASVKALELNSFEDDLEEVN